MNCIDVKFAMLYDGAVVTPLGFKLWSKDPEDLIPTTDKRQATKAPVAASVNEMWCKEKSWLSLLTTTLMV